jgi:hypothetical protein
LKRRRFGNVRVSRHLCGRGPLKAFSLGFAVTFDMLKQFGEGFKQEYASRSFDEVIQEVHFGFLGQAKSTKHFIWLESTSVPFLARIHTPGWHGIGSKVGSSPVRIWG